MVLPRHESKIVFEAVTTNKRRKGHEGGRERYEEDEETERKEARKVLRIKEERTQGKRPINGRRLEKIGK
jgi:hypothetical protein